MITFNERYLDRYMDKKEIDNKINENGKGALDKVLHGTAKGADVGLGWRDLPSTFDKSEIERIKKTASSIVEQSDVLVVIGIGGSYLGARAVIEAVQPNKEPVKVIYAGKDLSTIEYKKIEDELDGKNWSICIISKSGTTTEPAVALRLLRQKLTYKYGDKADERIYAITDENKGTLHDLAIAKGWPRFVVPDNIGGRYSVISPVGLLPIACAGIDIDQLLQGALDQSTDNSAALRYATVRNLLNEKGLSVEILATFEPSFSFVNEWWKQLFGESEGKNNKGIWPSSVVYTTDLHSLGQFVQDGSRIAFETFINVEESNDNVLLPSTSENDGVEYLSGKTLDFMNKSAQEATVKAHYEAEYGGVPINILNIPKLDAYNIGAFLYFMMMSCAISAYILAPDGNPFDQPGVEFYKKNMFKLLGKE